MEIIEEFQNPNEKQKRDLSVWKVHLLLEPSNNFYVFVSWTKVYCFFIFYHVATESSAGTVIPHLFTWKMDLSIFPDTLGLLWQVDLYIQICR